VVESIKFAKSKGVFVSLNLLVYPGLTDGLDEVELLVRYLKETGIDMIQLRNLNIDPDFVEQKIPPALKEPLGIEGMIRYIEEQVPGIIIGNFSRPLKK
jgi:pyruvate-formate lyase-activating enzyme